MTPETARERGFNPADVTAVQDIARKLQLVGARKGIAGILDGPPGQDDYVFAALYLMRRELVTADTQGTITNAMLLADAQADYDLLKQNGRIP